MLYFALDPANYVAGSSQDTWILLTVNKSINIPRSQFHFCNGRVGVTDTGFEIYSLDILMA